MSKCCICHRPTEAETSGILTMGGYGIPKYLCPECEEAVAITTSSEDSAEIRTAIEKLGRTLSAADTGDAQVISLVTGMIDEAGKRAQAIDDGSYIPRENAPIDSSEGEVEQTEHGEGAIEKLVDEDEFDITEDLEETEEDRLKDEKDAELTRKLDTVFSWISGALLIGVVIYFIIKLIL